MSPCIDKGNSNLYNLEVSESDFYGTNRIIGNAIDIGASEYSSDTVSSSYMRITPKRLHIQQEQCFDLNGKKVNFLKTANKVLIFRNGQVNKSSILLKKSELLKNYSRR